MSAWLGAAAAVARIARVHGGGRREAALPAAAHGARGLGGERGDSGSSGARPAAARRQRAGAGSCASRTPRRAGNNIPQHLFLAESHRSALPPDHGVYIKKDKNKLADIPFRAVRFCVVIACLYDNIGSYYRLIQKYFVINI